MKFVSIVSYILMPPLFEYWNLGIHDIIFQPSIFRLFIEKTFQPGKYTNNPPKNDIITKNSYNIATRNNYLFRPISLSLLLSKASL